MTADEMSEYDAETVRLLSEAEYRVAEAEADEIRAASAAKTAKKRTESEVDELRRLIRERRENRGAEPAPTLLDMLKGVAAPTWREVKVSEMPIADGIKAFLSFEPCKTAGDLADEIARAGEGDSVFGLSPGDLAEVKTALAEMSGPATATAELADLWRSYPIERWQRFGITAKDVEKLAAGELKRESDRRPIKTVGDLSNFSAETNGGFSRQLADIKGIGAAGATRISDAETAFWGWWRDGGETEFARERGVIRGDATIGGSDGGLDEAETGATVADNETADEPAEGDATDLYDGSARIADDEPGIEIGGED